MTKPLRIYIAGPFSASMPVKVGQNMTAAIDAQVALIKKGHFPFCPHLFFFTNARAEENGVRIDYEDWMRLDMAYLDVCQALLFLGHSPGADRELARAKAIGLPVYYFAGDVPDTNNQR